MVNKIHNIDVLKGLSMLAGMLSGFVGAVLGAVLLIWAYKTYIAK